jgi:hypothetical protein
MQSSQRTTAVPHKIYASTLQRTMLRLVTSSATVSVDVSNSTGTARLQKSQ